MTAERDGGMAGGAVLAVTDMAALAHFFVAEPTRERSVKRQGLTHSVPRGWLAAGADDRNGYRRRAREKAEDDRDHDPGHPAA